MTIRGKISFIFLGSSFNPLHVASWNSYLIKEKNEFIKRYEKKALPTAKVEDFVFIKKIGSGYFGTVFMCRHKKTQIYHASKLIMKKSLINKTDELHLKNEQKILASVSFPFLITLQYYLEDKIRIYLVLPLVIGGELFSYLVRKRCLEESAAKFYSSQILLALEYLHYMDVMYRDLKPENVLIDHCGYVKLTDFGFCKLSTRTYTLCGTPEYLAPEIILQKGYSKAVDWWAFGVFLYELLTGDTPFSSRSESKIYTNIIDCHYIIPHTFSTQVKNLITNLLQPDVTKRLGNLKGGVNDVKCHLWFSKTNWLALLRRSVPVPYVPQLEHIEDCSNFYEGVN